ncbi:protein kinase [Simiduia sp. 21SJ11W-1]|uniref:protein kinase domain-containing protein n=1 Tax=Simiduia sp. 21SJ11W-1 TaxID=2909669 RepID=UPI00209DC270|nr:protein kinase [Simiduia sp. 21SJ11W-1]UTA46796.1 protein kinase [Simiduia sp. 21SJ11W-1]
MPSIPGYQFKNLLGGGGSAQVWLAQQQSLDRPVAIKVLANSLVNDVNCQQLFAHESRLIARLNHPNIVQVIEQGQTEAGEPFFVMPYVKSITLTAILARADVALTRRLDILIQLAAALAYAHRNGVIHRDIKPANVLVDYEGHVRLVDFGIAGFFALEDDLVAGTQAYMAPEQHQGISHTSIQSDLFSFGMLMHELLYGLRPDAELASQKIEALHMHQPRLRGLYPLITQCLAPNPTLRPGSALVIREQLLLAAAGQHLGGNRWGLETERDQLPANYTLLDVLKENPVSSTYLVNDPNKGRLLVIKKQPANQQDRAARSAAKLTQIKHPHIARLFGTGKNQRTFISVTEYLPAGSLEDRLAQALAPAQWQSLAHQIFSALACAHSYGLVHGNLRPGNIMFASDDHLKLCDFGFAPHRDGPSPYQPNEPASPSADLYSAAAVLFEALTGHLPKGGLLRIKDRWRVRHYPLLGPLLLSLLHKKPAKRPASASQVVDQLSLGADQQATVISD